MKSRVQISLSPFVLYFTSGNRWCPQPKLLQVQILYYLMNFAKQFTYRCDVRSLSTNLESLRLWFLLIPIAQPPAGFPPLVKKFTLLRSPLGNKTSKDQFERRAYRGYFWVESKDACEILAIVDVLRHMNGVKCKINVSTRTNI